MTEKLDLIKNANRKVERSVGILAIIITFFIVAAIFTQMDIEPDIKNIHDDLIFLQENIYKLNVNSFIWLINSVLIIIFGPAVMISFLPHAKSSSYIAAFLISATGITCLLYAGSGFSIIFIVREIIENSPDETQLLIPATLNILIIKTNLQLIIYLMVGASSIILGLLIALKGYLPRFIGWVALTGGLIYAIFGCINPESLVFTAGRIIFILSLMLFGSFLLLRGITLK